jgi:guanylate kinase
MNAPLIISGPSGVGKTYLEKHLIQYHNFKRIQSTTTRPIRPGEVHGVDYNFITEQQYKQLEKQNRFITSSNHLNAWYAYEKSLVDEIIKENKTPVSVIVPTVVPQFLSVYPTTIAIYLKPISNDLLEKRMRQRGDSTEKIMERLKHEQEQNEYFEKDIQHLYLAVFLVTESNFEEIVKNILEITKLE